MKTDKDIAIKLQLKKLVSNIIQTDYCIYADEIYITHEIEKLIIDNADEFNAQVMHKKASDIAITIYKLIINIQIHQAATESFNSNNPASRLVLKDTHEKIVFMIYEFLKRKNQTINCFASTLLFEALSLNISQNNEKTDELTSKISIKTLQAFGFIENDIILLHFLTNPDFSKMSFDNTHLSNSIKELKNTTPEESLIFNPAVKDLMKKNN